MQTAAPHAERHDHSPVRPVEEEVSVVARYGHLIRLMPRSSPPFLLNTRTRYDSWQRKGDTVGHVGNIAPVVEQLLHGTAVAIFSSPLLGFEDFVPLATALNRAFRTVTVRRNGADMRTESQPRSVFSVYFSAEPIVGAVHPPASDTGIQLLQTYAEALLRALASDATGIRAAMVDLIGLARERRDHASVTGMILCELGIGSLVFACDVSVTLDTFSWKCLRAIDSVATLNLAAMNGSGQWAREFAWDAAAGMWALAQRS
jgi:hypothetical protein